MMTLGLLRCFHERNKIIPDDLSVVTYDNTLNPFLQGTELTSIDQNMHKLAVSACEILIEHIEQTDMENKIVCLEPHLVRKNSVKKL